MKKKTIYVLRIRNSDDDEWGDPAYFLTKKARDRSAMINRILGYVRTYSYEEKKTLEEIENLTNQ